MGKGEAAEVEGLPRTIVRRVVKEKLLQSAGDDINLHKDALIAFSESARIFIHYLSATANDICKESKRQIINADDVLKAIEEIEFPEFIGSLRASLDVFRQKNASKRSAKQNGSDKKRKLEEDIEGQNTEDAGDDVKHDGTDNEDEDGRNGSEQEGNDHEDEDGRDDSEQEGNDHEDEDGRDDSEQEGNDNEDEDVASDNDN